MRVISALAAREYLDRLREWFIAEWGADGGFDLGEAIGPGPLIAIENGAPLGGLAFAHFERPDSDTTGLWINALFVSPEHRRRGVASALLRAAETRAAALGEGGLYALTDVPGLYVRLGWRCIRSDSTGTVVGKAIAK